MSAPMNGATAGGTLGALIPPDKAQRLLEDVLYERVLGMIDLRRLFELELDLWVAISEIESTTDIGARSAAKEMIDRALRRLADDRARYARVQPFAMDCEACEEEAREEAHERRSPRVKRAG